MRLQDDLSWIGSNLNKFRPHGICAIKATGMFIILCSAILFVLLYFINPTDFRPLLLTFLTHISFSRYWVNLKQLPQPGPWTFETSHYYSSPWNHIETRDWKTKREVDRHEFWSFTPTHSALRSSNLQLCGDLSPNKVLLELKYWKSVTHALNRIITL